MKTGYQLFCIVLCITLLSCSKKPATDTTEQPAAAPQNGEIAAVVNGEKITKDEVEFTIDIMFGHDALVPVDATLQEKVLESMIASKAMKQAMQDTLSEQERAVIAAKAKKYEEELYVKAYLQEHAQAQPVTSQMVKDYYDTHIDKFSSPAIKHFEMLYVKDEITEEQRATLFAQQKDIQQSDDWAHLASSSRLSVSLSYMRSKSAKGLLDEKISSVLDAVQPGQTSGFFFYNEKPAMLRVVDVQQGVPAPLSEVSADIRETLAPQQLKKAIKQVTENVLADAKVERQ